MSDKQEQPETTKLVVPCEIYSRIVGYMAPVRQWNTGKRQEFKERVTFDLTIPQKS
jgi:anaerobic ribonucleoside-triphosphate reductase